LPEDKKYVRGAVEKVGYGIERFLFLKVGRYVGKMAATAAAAYWG
jgi:hypothetical protein